MSAPFPPVPGVAREPLPVMTHPSRWERFLGRFTPMTPAGWYRPSRLNRKDGAR